MAIKTVYKTEDNEEFPTLALATAHEVTLAATKQDAYDRYTKNCYSGKQLLRSHSLSESGIWEVFGEDPNCDMGGHHHEPYLGKFSGTLEDVIRHAVTMSGFWQWGGGGRIRRSDVETITQL